MSIIAQQLRCSSPLLLSMRHQRRWWCWREKKGVRIWVEVRLHAASSEAGVSRVSFILSRRPDGVRHENEPHTTTPCRHSHTFPLSPIPPSLSTVQTRSAASVKQRPPPCHRLRRLSSPPAQGGCDALLTQMAERAAIEGDSEAATAVCLLINGQPCAQNLIQALFHRSGNATGRIRSNF